MPKKTCFIIMPITTPASLLDDYQNDAEHFKHVLEHLFIPAIKAANFKPIEPASTGSEVIHADIIQNIESADMVLCDMSSLNPNVFFELGIRTALNKPTCLVVDDETKGKVPFDIGLINHHPYKTNLEIWHHESEVKNLTEHIKSSVTTPPVNSLWKYFSMSMHAQPISDESGGESSEKLDFLNIQVDALRRDIAAIKNVGKAPQHESFDNLIGKWNDLPMQIHVTGVEEKITKFLEALAEKSSNPVLMLAKRAHKGEFNKGEPVQTWSIGAGLDEVKDYSRMLRGLAEKHGVTLVY